MTELPPVHPAVHRTAAYAWRLLAIGLAPVWWWAIGAVLFGGLLVVVCVMVGSKHAAA